VNTKQMFTIASTECRQKSQYKHVLNPVKMW